MWVLWWNISTKIFYHKMKFLLYFMTNIFIEINHNIWLFEKIGISKHSTIITIVSRMDWRKWKNKSSEIFGVCWDIASIKPNNFKMKRTQLQYFISYLLGETISHLRRIINKKKLNFKLSQPNNLTNFVKNLLP